MSVSVVYTCVCPLYLCIFSAYMYICIWIRCVYVYTWLVCVYLDKCICSVHMCVPSVLMYLYCIYVYMYTCVSSSKCNTSYARILYSVGTARSREDQTRNGYRNTKRNPRLSKLKSLFKWAVWKETCDDHRGFRFVFRWPFRVSSSRERAVQWASSLVYNGRAL